MTEHYCHDSHMKKADRLTKMVSWAVLIGAGGAAILLRQTGQQPTPWEMLFYLLLSIALCGTLLDRLKMADIAFDPEGFRLKVGRKERSFTYAELEDIKCFQMSGKIFGLLPIWKDRVLLIEATKDRSERYYLRKSGLERFDDVRTRLEERYTAFLRKKYGGRDLAETPLYFGNKLWINKGKLRFGPSYSVPVKHLYVREGQKGKIEIVYVYDDGRERVWTSLDPMRFENTFEMRYVINDLMGIRSKRQLSEGDIRTDGQ